MSWRLARHEIIIHHVGVWIVKRQLSRISLLVRSRHQVLGVFGDRKLTLPLRRRMACLFDVILNSRATSLRNFYSLFLAPIVFASKALLPWIGSTQASSLRAPVWIFLFGILHIVDIHGGQKCIVSLRRHHIFIGTLSKHHFLWILQGGWYNFVSQLWGLFYWLIVQSSLFIMERGIASFKSGRQIHVSRDNSSINETEHAITQVVFSDWWRLSERIVSKVLW